MNLASFLPAKLPFPSTDPSNRAAGRTASASSPARSAIRRPRILYVLGIFLFWTLAICIRLVWVQLVMHHHYLDKASRQQTHGFEIAPRRGILYDRNLRELAVSTLADSVFAVPYEVSSSNDPVENERAKTATAIALAKVVHTDPRRQLYLGRTDRRAPNRLARLRVDRPRSRSLGGRAG